MTGTELCYLFNVSICLECVFERCVALHFKNMFLYCSLKYNMKASMFIKIRYTYTLRRGNQCYWGFHCDENLYRPRASADCPGCEPRQEAAGGDGGWGHGPPAYHRRTIWLLWWRVPWDPGMEHGGRCQTKKKQEQIKQKAGIWTTKSTKKRLKVHQKET